MNPFIKEQLEQIRNGELKTIWFDIDGTLFDTEDALYDQIEPDRAMITLVNMLYDQGHNIILVTARGATSKINYEWITRRQLIKWGVKYHELIMGRPKDLYIGDEAIRPDEFLEVI